ncbi:DUF2955 domain-containing protein [Ferrimonas sediminicola]|nr:DUF2955 domain-containing protein [Ferrimonas sediminicola]
MLRRLWLGCTLAFAVATLMNWKYGAMFAPLLVLVLLSRLQRWNGATVGRMLLAIATICLVGNLIIGFLQPYPPLMFAAVALWMAMNCIAMTHPATYMMGYAGMAVGSMFLNVGSFGGFDLVDFTLDLLMAALLASLVTALMFLAFPSPSSPPVQPAAQPDPRELTRNLKICWTLVMLIFTAFQALDLADSMAAQGAAILVVAPMNFSGSLLAARMRIIGTILGCSAAIALQLLLYTWMDNLILYLLGFTLAFGLFAYWVCQGGEHGGIGFAAASALVVLLCGVVPGQADLFFSSLYRFSSILITVTMTTLMLMMFHRWQPAR